MQKLKPKYTEWNLKLLFENDDDPKIDEYLKKYEKESYKFINKWKNNSKYLENPQTLKQALDELEELSKEYIYGGAAGYYIHLRQRQEQDNPKIKAKNNKIHELLVKVTNDIQFFDIKLSKVNQQKQQEFLESKELADYKHYLKTLFENAKYILPEEQEKILNLLSKTAYSDWVNMVSEFISKEEREVTNEQGKKEKAGINQMFSLMMNNSPKIRDQAALAFNDILSTNLDVATQEINSILSYKKTVDELKGLERPDLGRFISDDIEPEVVDTLVNAVTNKFDTANNYYKFKAKLFELPTLKYHERILQYGKLEKEYNYEEALNLVYKTFINLDTEFAEILKKYTEQGNIDVYPRKGKYDNAFCTHNAKNQPTYILLNHTNKISDVKTLAHEMGHAINNELIQKQNALNYDTPLSTAEVASTFMEDFVLQEIEKQADDELKLALKVKKLDDAVASIYRQIACINFERELHKTFRETGYVSKEKIGELFKKHMQAYMGDFVEQSEGSENWWVYWGHIRTFFYNYTYCSGRLIAMSLQNSVKQNPKFIKKVKEFLSAGTSDSPKNIFAKMDIDITDEKFWNKGLEEVEQLLNETQELAKKLGKI